MLDKLNFTQGVGLRFLALDAKALSPKAAFNINSYYAAKLTFEYASRIDCSRI